jgi:hypothetical protein
MKRKLLSILLSSLLIFVSIGSAIVFPQEVNATAPVTVVNGEIAPQDAPWTGVTCLNAIIIFIIMCM